MRFLSLLVSLIAASALAQNPIGPAGGSGGNHVNSATQLQLDTKAPKTRTISTTAPLTGGGDLSGDRTFAMTLADSTHSGYLSSANWNTFNGKIDAAGVAALIGVTIQGYNVATTTAGNTFNGNSQLVQLNSSGQLPAIDIHNASGLTAGQIPNLDAGKITTGIIAYQRLGTGGDGSGTHILADNGAFISLAGASGGTVTSVSMTVPSWLNVTGTITTSGTFAVTATSGQTANLFLATPDGTTGTVGLRAIVAGDLSSNLITFAKLQQLAASSLTGNASGSTGNISTIGIDGSLSFSGSTLRAFSPAAAISAFAIDWSLSKTRTKTLSAGTNTFTWSNSNDGDSIMVKLKQVPSGTVGTVAFPTLGADGSHVTYWAGGSQPVQSSTANKMDIYQFVNIGGDIYASAIQNF